MTRRSSNRPPPDQPPLPLHVPKRQCAHSIYQLTCAQYDAMRWRAGDRCEICGTRAEEVQKRPLYIDHDSRLGNGWNHVRGLLCARCNSGMRYVDNGYRKPRPDQLRYIKTAWFWQLVPPDLLDEPWFPSECEEPNEAARWDQSPMYRRRKAAIELAKAEGRKLRTTRTGRIVWC